MPEWLARLSQPENIVILGGIGMVLGVFLRNFIKGFKEAAPMPLRQGAPQSPAYPGKDQMLEGMGHTMGSILSVLRDIRGATELDRMRQAEIVSAIEANDRRLERLETQLEAMTRVLHERRADSQIIAALLGQIRDHLKSCKSTS